MGRANTINTQQLDRGFVILPERYDPLRFSIQRDESHVRLKDVVSIFNKQVQPNKADPKMNYLILDTGDAKDGAVPFPKEPVGSLDIGSSKKMIQPGDVIISRLRPYLRQVAYIDEGLASDGSIILCSTEFFVLRSNSGKSIAYLVPLLLSDTVQSILAVSQEGGHHPRFNPTTLENILIPAELYSCRDAVSLQVEEAVHNIRNGVTIISEIVANLSMAK